MVRKNVTWAGALALAVMAPMSAVAESLTLTTYYPAPYGVYQKLRATDSTYLAYQNGAVSVGRIPDGTGGGPPTTLGGTDKDVRVNFPQNGYAMDINGKVLVRNYVHITQNSCREVPGGGGWSWCTANTEYAAWLPGLWQDGESHIDLPRVKMGLVDVNGNWLPSGTYWNMKDPYGTDLRISYSDEPGSVHFYCCKRVADNVDPVLGATIAGP